MAHHKPADQAPPPRKGFWTFIIAAVATVGAVITGLATFTDGLGNLWGKRDYVVRIFERTTSFTLRDVKKVYQQASAAKNHEKDYEVLIEAVASRAEIKKCAADLDVSSGKDYYRAADKSGNDTAVDSSDYGFIRFTFFIPKLELPDQGKIRLRCQGAISEWAKVDWPVDVKKQTFHLCLGEMADRCSGAGIEHLGCGTNVENWLRSAHADVCKNVQVRQIGTIDGNRCGYAFFEAKCSNVPIND